MPKTGKVQNKISYYVNGNLITTNVLLQPPETLTDSTLSAAIAIVINANVNGSVKILNATARITQGKQLIKEFTIHTANEPP